MPSPRHRHLLVAALIVTVALLIIVGAVTYYRVDELMESAPLAKEQRGAVVVAVLTAVTFLLAVGASLLAGLQVRRELVRRRIAEDNARSAYEVVEAKVEERTEELADALARERDAREVAERASRLKDEFLATVSHELRTPLNAIIGWVHVLKSGSLSRADAARAIDAIDRNARAQTLLVSDLLDEASLSQGLVVLAVRPCNLEALVRKAAGTLAAAAAARALRIDMMSEDPTLSVDGDEARLSQVVRNLLANAVKFTPAGGQIRVETGRAGDQALVRVIDSGEGIEPEFLPFVFDPFRQSASGAKRAGLGLGLSLVKQLVELHGGTVNVASDGRGHGATFSFSLPISQSATRLRLAERA